MPNDLDQLLNLGDDASPEAVQPNDRPGTVTFPPGSEQFIHQQPGQSATAQALRDDGSIDNFLADHRQAQQDGADRAFVISARDGAQAAAAQWQDQVQREKAIHK